MFGTKKRCLAVFLLLAAVCAILWLFPGTGMAASVTVSSEAELRAALTGPADEILIAGNISIASATANPLLVSRNLTISGSGGSRPVVEGCWVIDSAAQVTMEDLDLRCVTGGGSTPATVQLEGNNTKLTMNNCAVTHSEPRAAAIVDAILLGTTTTDNRSNITLILNGCTVNATKVNGRGGDGAQP